MTGDPLLKILSEINFQGRGYKCYFRNICRVSKNFIFVRGLTVSKFLDARVLFFFGSVVADALHFTRFIENTKKDNGVSKAILMNCNNIFQMIAMSFTKEVT